MASMIPEPVAVLIAAVLLDALLGDPRDSLHPVAWFGSLAAATYRRAPTHGTLLPFVHGLVLALALPAFAAGVAYGACAIVRGLDRGLGAVMEVLVLTSCFASRSLIEAGERVRASADRGATDDARAGLGALCSRDARELDVTTVRASAIESLAENTSDSIVAPLLAYALFGIAGAAAYRAINTLDAMYGYRDHREFVGKAAARLDDLANLIPARVTALLSLLAGALLRYDVARGVRVLCRDRGLTASPNAGWPMAAASGLLGVRLDKPGVYALGADLGPADDASLQRACRLVAATTALALPLAALVAGGRDGF